MKIALLGGAFNPPHVGHLMIARQVLDYSGVDEVWFLPNFRQTPPKPVESVEHRLAMTKLMETDNMRVSTIEIDNKLDGQTIHVLPHLPKEHSYYFVIGADQLATFHLWGEEKKLRESMTFLVFPRYGYRNEPLYPGMTVLRSEILIETNISSTKIRERVKRGLSISEFVTPKVEEYISIKGLYR